jgi:hypothetical protein
MHIQIVQCLRLCQSEIWRSLPRVDRPDGGIDRENDSPVATKIIKTKKQRELSGESDGKKRRRAATTVPSAVSTACSSTGARLQFPRAPFLERDTFILGDGVLTNVRVFV